MPDPVFAEEWADALPYPPIRDEGLQLYGDTTVTIGSMSAIASAHADGLNAIELEFFEKLSQRCERNIARAMPVRAKVPSRMSVKPVYCSIEVR